MHEQSSRLLIDYNLLHNYMSSSLNLFCQNTRENVVFLVNISLLSLSMDRIDSYKYNENRIRVRIIFFQIPK